MQIFSVTRVHMGSLLSVFMILTFFSHAFSFDFLESPAGLYGFKRRNPVLCISYSQEAQTVKKLLAMQETWVQSLGWEEPLEKEMATHSRIPA